MMSSEHSGAGVGLPSDAVRTSDRELLELAARAAGWDGWRSKHGYWNITSPEGQKHVCCQGWSAFDPYTGEKRPEPTFADALMEANWNPLQDDGDALRLALRLRIDVSFNPDRVIAWPAGGDPAIETHRGDPAAATRRAIVQAAAALAGQDADTEPARSNEQSPSS